MAYNPPIGSKKNTTYIPLIVLAFLGGFICYRSHLFFGEPENPTIDNCVFFPKSFPAQHLGLEKQHGIPAGQGLEESSATQHDVCRVELLMAKVRVEVLFR